MDTPDENPPKFCKIKILLNFFSLDDNDPEAVFIIINNAPKAVFTLITNAPEAGFIIIINHPEAGHHQ
jgi:hypothetical protein